jgi:hypothetical protein
MEQKTKWSQDSKTEHCHKENKTPQRCCRISNVGLRRKQAVAKNSFVP